MLGFGLILPLLPYYAETFGASDTVIGLLVASYAAAQLLGAPLLGRLSDRFGRRPILLISLVGTLLGFLLLGFASTLFVLFAARILDGITGGNISVAQAYISDVTDSKNRAKGLGMIGAAFGLGFIIGPATGGLLSQWGYAVPAFAAAGLVAINLLMVALWLPESLPRKKNYPSRKENCCDPIRAFGRAQTTFFWATTYHTILFWFGFRYLPNHLCTLCPAPFQPGRDRNRLHSDLRGCAIGDRTGWVGWTSEPAFPR